MASRTQAPGGFGSMARTRVAGAGARLVGARLVGATVLVLAALLSAPGCASIDGYLRDLSVGDQEDRIDAANELVEAVWDGDAEAGRRRAQIVGTLRRAVGDSSALVRQIAVASLADLRATEAGPVIIDRLRDRNLWVRRAAARALGVLRFAPAREPLERALARDREAMVRREAALALALLRGRSSLRALYLGLGDGAVSVRYACADGLRRITGRKLGVDPRAWRPVVGG